MIRRKIVLQTDAPFLRSGLAENGRILMNWLARRGKYDLVYYCSQVSQNDPNLSRLPYKAYGAIPGDPNWIHTCSGDWGRVRDVHYGGRFIQDVIKAEKPDIWIGSNDAWSFPAHYFTAPWFKQINSVLHITVDSVPVAPLAYEQAAATPHFLSWAKFAVGEMKRVQPKVCGHVDFIYGATDVNKFRPVSSTERIELRRMAGLDPQDTIFIKLGRNQLRKQFLSCLMGFAEFKRTNPTARAKLLLHTCWRDVAQGWDLPRHRDYLGLKKEDVLATYYCRNCRRWEVKPFTEEGLNCRFCGAQKSQVTPDGFGEGVEDDDMYQIYGLADASISAFTSGGLEYTSINSLLCGLPLACTNYSCGEDFCEQPFVHALSWHPTHEVQSSFKKAATDVNAIAAFMARVHAMRAEERRDWGVQGRAWAEQTFSADAVGTKWERLFDSMPPKDWSSITLTPQLKNDKAPLPDIADPAKWVRALYNQILLCEPDPDGLKNWMMSLERGASRQAIYEYFIGEARKENAKYAAPQDFWTLIDRTTGRKRAICVIKESIGDCIMMTQLFESFHQQYPDHDLYVATDPRYFEVFAGNPWIFRVLPYHAQMEHELAMTGAGRSDEPYFHKFLHPAVPTQRLLNYLSADQVAYDLNAA